MFVLFKLDIYKLRYCHLSEPINFLLVAGSVNRSGRYPLIPVFMPMMSLINYTCLAGRGLTVSPTSQHVNFLSSEAGMKCKQNKAF